MSHDEQVLEFQNLSKKYRNRLVLSDVNARVPLDSLSFIAGKNGAGKSTLFKCILGLESFEGSIKSPRNSTFFPVFDRQPVYGRLSVLGNARLMLEGAPGQPSCGEIESALSSFLSQDNLRRPIRRLSYGQRKYFSFVLARLARADFTLLDEISNGLDYELAQRVRTGIREMLAYSTVICVGHDFPFFNGIADHVYFLRNGQLECCDERHQSGESIEEIYVQLAH